MQSPESVCRINEYNDSIRVLVEKLSDGLDPTKQMQLQLLKDELERKEVFVRNFIRDLRDDFAAADFKKTSANRVSDQKIKLLDEKLDTETRSNHELNVAMERLIRDYESVMAERDEATRSNHKLNIVMERLIRDYESVMAERDVYKSQAEFYDDDRVLANLKLDVLQMDFDIQDMELEGAQHYASCLENFLYNELDSLVRVIKSVQDYVNPPPVSCFEIFDAPY